MTDKSRSQCWLPTREVENVAFPLEMRHTPRDQVISRVREALSLVKLEGYDNRRPNQLSGGQQQRVALARALAFESRLLLMDEPLGALDKKLREHLQIELKQIQKRLGITVIYVTHDQHEALSLSDSIVVMNEGRIEQIGTPHELYDEPQSEFVADFIGETNLLNGVVRAATGPERVQIALAIGPVIDARARGALPLGTRIKASLRPERIIVARPGQSSNKESVCRGEVSEIIFLGDATKMNVAVSGMTMSAKVQSGQLAWRPSVGEAVDISWDPRHVTVLDVR